jgi:hypothetical protein
MLGACGIQTGSLAELNDAVCHGLTVKCGIHRISALAMGLATAAASARDDTICFLPSLQPLITDGGGGAAWC